MIGRAKVPSAESRQYIALSARVELAVAVVDERLRVAGSNRALADALLDIRNVLKAPERAS